MIDAVLILDRNRSFSQTNKRYLTIVDRDYDLMLGRRIRSPNLLYSDKRDLECMLYTSTALEKVLIQNVSSENIFRIQHKPISSYA
ncbi:hypothetical protein CEE45_03450 [Candidatus Heimdallarchaeota archaeon B3_Heim]|nr:MAG: hypothetical protein CEE45_03450 [Candidatus Heimdallarchaeota archaeon B3_Heim]